MFLLDPDKLRDGDIILTSQRTLLSKSIRKITLGQYSHAILHVGGHCFIHADGDGVHSNNVQRLLFEDSDQVRVLRVRCINNELLNDVCVFARRQVGVSYSVPEAVKSASKRKTSQVQKSNRQFCSRLVAQAYASVGVKLVDNPDYCYPEDILSCDLLEVVESPTRLALPAEIDFAISDSPLERQIQSTNFILDNARRILKKDIQQFEELGRELLAAPEYDLEVCKIIEQSGYLTLWQIERDRNPWRYNADIFRNLPIERDRLFERANQERVLALSELKRYRHMYIQYQILTAKHRLSYFALQLGLYDTLIKQAQCWLSTASFLIDELSTSDDFDNTAGKRGQGKRGQSPFN